jgi:hypothetical protein
MMKVVFKVHNVYHGKLKEQGTDGWIMYYGRPTQSARYSCSSPVKRFELYKMPCVGHAEG